MIKGVKLNRFKIEIRGQEIKVKLKGLNASREDTVFLNNIFTNDIANLKPFHFNYNLMLKHNGSPIEEFFVYNFGNFYLLDTDCLPRKIIEEFEKIKLSLRVLFRDVSDKYDHYFVWGEGAYDFVKYKFGKVPEDGCFAIHEDVILAKNSIRLKEIGFDIIGKGIENLIEDVEIVNIEEFEDIRIRQGVPAIHKELKEGFSPLEAGIEKYAISFSKGCYTGQEAIARVHYKGRLPRKLVVFKTVGDIKEGDTIFISGEKVGKVTSVSPISPIAMGYISSKLVGRNIEFETPKGRLFLL